MELLIELQGGLGNQLFQFALAKELAARLHYPVKFDISSYVAGDIFNRQLVLDRFFPEDTFAEIPRTQGDSFIEELPADSLPRLLEAIAVAKNTGANRVRLRGYFQHERFCPGSAPEIKQRLRQLTQSLRFSLEEGGRETIAVHIRRHDYAHLGICADSYFIAAIEWLRKKWGDKSRIYLFSDEPSYSQHLMHQHGLDDVVLVKPGEAIQDFLWLCSFKHYVLSNSSYSWWGAYVGEEEDSLIFSPSAPWLLVSAEINPVPGRWISVPEVVGSNISLQTARNKIREARFSQTARLYMSKSSGRFSVSQESLYPCLEDECTKHEFDAHYVYHTAWAARQLARLGIKEHHDFGSCLRFATIASAFLDRFVHYDYRKLNLKLENYESHQADLQELQIEGDTLGSVSCMHVLEHIGLGRYGDRITPDADIKAARELVRVIKSGGYLMLVVPVGQERLEFNAHRIYDPKRVLTMFEPLELLEFSLLPDDISGGLHKNASLLDSQFQKYACGCFLFKKN